MTLTTRARRGLASTVAAALTAAGVIALASPSQAAPTAVSNASLAWSLSNEQGGGAFAGGCNFLAAGTAGNTGSSRPWTAADNFYKTSSGNVRIEKPGANGDVTPIWATKCLDKDGKAVTASSAASTTQNRVRFSNGTGTYDPATGAGTISWTGSFTSAFYGGMTYWSATNPTLVVDSAGNGTLTATASGYGTSMADQTQWVALEARTITLAEFTGVDITASGFTATPKYLGQAVTVPTGAIAQVTTGSSWGSFPQSFVSFQGETGQSSYWYSSGGQRDAAKPASPVALTFGSTPAPPTEIGPVVAPPVVAPPAPAPAAVKAATAKPTVKVSKKPTSTKKGKATVSVKSKTGSTKPAGTVKVTLTKGKTKKNLTVTLKNGKATVSLPKLKKGTWKLKAVYAGSATQLAATSKTYTVKSTK